MRPRTASPRRRRAFAEPSAQLEQRPGWLMKAGSSALMARTRPATSGEISSTPKLPSIHRAHSNNERTLIKLHNGLRKLSLSPRPNSSRGRDSLCFSARPSTTETKVSSTESGPFARVPQCTERCFVRSTSSSRRSLDLVSQSTSGRLLFDDRDNSSDFDSDESEFSCTNSVFSALPLDVGDTEDRYSPSRHYPRAEFNVEQAHFNRFREREARRTSPADHESFVAELLFRVTEVESKILQRQQSANTERRDLLKEMQKLRASGKSRQRAIEDLRVEIEAHEQLSENRRATAALRKQRQRRRFKLRRVRAWIEEFNKLQKHEEENKLGSESQLRQLPTSLKVFLRERQRIFDRESIDNAATSDELLQLSQPTLSEHPMLWLAWRQARHCAERESLQRSLSQLLDKQSESTKTLPQASRKLFALQTLVGNTYDLAVLALDRQKRRNERRQRRLSGLRNSNDALRKRVAATQLALQQALLLTSK